MLPSRTGGWGMTITTAQRPDTSYDEWRARHWRWTGAFLGLMVVIVAALLVTTGVRPATYGDLLGDVASSKVSEVQVLGPDTPSAGDRIELRWSVLADVLDQYAVVQISDDRGYDAWQESVFVTSANPIDTLRDINPSISITPGSLVGDSSFSFMDWRVPGPVALLAMMTWLAVLLLLVGGPEPWRATRWAWGWCVLVGGPLGCVAYLLLGGPLGVLRPRDLRRRLTGGWAFLIVLVLFGGDHAG